MRRFIDSVIAAGVLVVTGPVLAFAAAAVFIGDRHNPIFSQTRLGKSEQEFTLYKLRTMRPDTPNVTSHELSQAALTPLGSTLRRLKLDELPQMINVIKGEMTLVGPRPGLPGDDRLTVARRQHGVFSVLPGITGLAQVRGVDMSEPEMLAKLDGDYLNSRSVFGDLRLILQTATGQGSGDALGAAQ